MATNCSRWPKEESSDDEEDEPTVVRVKCEQPNEDMALFAVMRNILSSRKAPEIRSLADKLDRQGITESSKLKVLSKGFVERKIGEGLTAGEVADVLQVWEALQASKNQNSRHGRHPKGASKGNSSKGSKGARNRSRSPRGDRGRHRGRGGGANTPRSSSKASLGGRSSRSDPEPPPLFTAIRNDDVEEVRRLLNQGATVDERHQGWTPLMCASEIGNFSIALLLLEKGANVAATNRRGRCSLSFAAAPSRDEAKQEQRVSATELIKLLMSHGANPARKDERGKTPRDYAEADSRKPQTSDPRFKRSLAAGLLRDAESA